MCPRGNLNTLIQVLQFGKLQKRNNLSAFLVCLYWHGESLYKKKSEHKNVETYFNTFVENHFDGDQTALYSALSGAFRENP